MIKKSRKNVLLILAAAVVLPLILALSLLLAPTFAPEAVKADEAAHTSAFGSATDHDENAVEYTGGLTPAGGIYYLTGPVNVSSITISDTVFLCLNGFTITGDGSGSVINVVTGGTLYLHDCKGGGCITGGNAENGGGVYVQSGSFDSSWILTTGGGFNMYGGTISGNTATNGGGVYVEPEGSWDSSAGEFNMYGGTISGNTATANGGGVSNGDEPIYNDSKINLLGGTIGGFDEDGNPVGNKAKNGGGVYFVGLHNISVAGVTISGNEATENGGGICWDFNDWGQGFGYATVKGNKAKNGGGMYLSSSSNYAYLVPDSTTGKTYTFIDNEATEYGGGLCFSGKIFYVDATIKRNKAKNGGGISSVPVEYDSGYNEFYWNGGMGIIGGYDEDGNPDGNEATENGGGLWLQSRVRASYNSAPISGSGICGNTAGENGGGVYIKDSTFDIQPTEMEDGSYSSFIISDNTAKNGGGIYLDKSTDELEGQTIVKTSPLTVITGNTATENGGGLYCEGSSQRNNDYIELKCTLGGFDDEGNPIGNKAKNGGGAYIGHWGCVKKADGDWSTAICGNEAENGGGIYVYGGYYIGDAPIYGNKAKNGGGAYCSVSNLYKYEESWVDASKIYGNVATENGGGVYVERGKFGSSAIIGGEDEAEANSAKNGGGMYVADVDLDYGNVVIKGNNATGNGGGVYMEGGYLEYCSEISGNRAEGNGGGVYMENGLLKCDIIGNRAEGNGGGVYMENGSLSRSYGGSIIGNSAGKNGGGVYSLDGTLDLIGRTIKSNEAIENGGGVYIGGGELIYSAPVYEWIAVWAKFNYDNYLGTEYGTITENRAKIGGGIYSTVSFEVYGGTIIGNTNIDDETINSNLYLSGDAKLNMGYPPVEGLTLFLDPNTNIGLSRGPEAEKVFTLDYTATGNDAEKYDQYFFADTGECLWMTDGEVAIGHKVEYVHEKEDESCTEDGVAEYRTCSLCEKNFSDAACANEITDLVLPALGHTMDDFDEVAARCGVAGHIAYSYCERCENYFAAGTENVISEESIVIPALEHNWVEQSTEATCLDGGTTYYVCSRCGNDKSGTVGPLGHDFVYVEGSVTCVSAGTDNHYHCQRCGLDSLTNTENDIKNKSESDPLTIAALGHTYERVGFDGEPTWEWTGYTSATATFVCTECEVGVTGHTHTETAEIVDTTTPAKCTEDGLTTYTATINVDFGKKEYKDIKTEVLDATGHDWVASWGNWNKENWTVSVIVQCTHNNDCEGKVSTTVTGVPSVTTPETCTEKGVKTYTASIDFTDPYTSEQTTFTCSEKPMADIAPHGHDWNVTVTDNTAKQPYYVFDKFSLNGYTVTFTCEHDNSHTETFTDGANATITYNDGECLHLDDTSVSVTTTLTTYDGASDTYTINGITVSKRAAEDVVWQYSSDNTDWTTLNNNAEFTYDTKTYTVRVKFPAYSGDDIATGEYYTVNVDTFNNYKTYGYKFELTEYGNYTIADSVRSLMVNKAKITVGGEKWICDGDELLSGFVKQDGTEYKFYPAMTEGATEVTNAVVRYVDGEVRVDYDQPAEHKNLYSVGYYNPGNIFSASGKYTVTALFTLKNPGNYELVAAEGATITGSITATVTKDIYFAICDNGFKGGIDGWTFGSTASALPDLEKEGTDVTVSLVLKLDGEPIGVAFDRSSYSQYVNSTMPAGEYTLKATVSATTIDGVEYEGFTRTFAFTVSKAEFTVSDLADLTDIEYDGNLHISHAYTLTSELITEGTGVWTDYENLYSDTAITYSHSDWSETYYTVAQIEAMTGNKLFINAADNAYVALYKISALNYEDVTGSYSVKINKATYDMTAVTFPDGDEDLEYDGNPHSIFISGKLPEGVTVSYDGNGKTDATADGYTVIAKFTGDSVNYEPIEDMDATLYINKAKIALNLSFEDYEVEYDPINPTWHSITLTGVIPTQVKVVYENNEAITVGKHDAKATVSIKDEYLDNYEFAANTTTVYEAKLNIKQATIKMNGVKFEGKTVKYTGNAYSLYISGTLPKGVTYSYENNECVTVGKYTVKVHFYHSFSYYAPIPDMEAMLIIEKADYNMKGVTFPDATVAYTGNAHSLAIRGILPAGVTYEYENNSLTNVGSRLVTVKFTGDSENYNPIPDMEATLRVVPASFGLNGISLEGATVDYDGKTHRLAVNGALPEGITVKYYVNIDGEEVEFNGAINANTYDVIAKFVVVDSVNYKAPRPLTAKLTIVGPEKTERPTEITEPTTTEIAATVINEQDYNKSPNVVLAEIAEKSEFPYWIIAVCVIAVEVVAMLGMLGYIAFGAYKRKKR